jgi:hypothetical protein
MKVHYQLDRLIVLSKSKEKKNKKKRKKENKEFEKLFSFVNFQT